ncbi:hypothetical protein L3Q72_14980 [Vibrio sp. JC009]|uniref:hypothetical protein n=1 Tax=Vibrio sp. JC009 TaxID=2912314 RepID=UPI0023B16A97|nr:hypothetical protein [Vibrio sp. JC009]WED24186.1 hypothetical protein L3Q72_14980 [Vibrio sp. JC009]
MERVLFSGCTTSASSEAPAIDVKTVAKKSLDSKAHIRKKKRKKKGVYFISFRYESGCIKSAI